MADEQTLQDKIETMAEKGSSERGLSIWSQYLLNPENINKIDLKHVIKQVCGDYYNPYIQNSRVKNIFSRTISGIDRDKIEEALENPEASEQLLRGYSKTINYASYPMYKKNRVYSDILTYNYYSTPCLVKNEDKLEDDSILISSWERSFAPKYQFRRIASQVAIEGKVAYYYRQELSTSGGNISCYDRKKEEVTAAFLQALPADWWKIVGFTDKNYYKVAFNFMYFLQPGCCIEQFDSFFQEVFLNMQENIVETNIKIKGSLKFGNKHYAFKEGADLETVEKFTCENKEWFYWVELPVENTFVFSEQEATALAAPSSLGTFLQARDLDSYALLQQQLSELPLNSMVVGEIPYFENNLSGNDLNDFRITPDAIDFYNNMFNETAPAGTGAQALPYKNLKLLQFEGVPNGSEIYLKAMQQFLITTGMGSLFTLTDKPNAIQVKTAQILESRYSDYIYEQFKNFVNIVFDFKLPLKNRWCFNIFGDAFRDEETLTALKDALALGQSYVLPKYMAMFDQTVVGANATMTYIDKLGVYDKFKVIASAYNTKQDKGGRPSTDLNKVKSDETVKTLDKGEINND